MATMNISLPDPMREWVESRIKTGLYASSSDYMRDLIRHDHKYHQKLESLRSALAEGEKSGPAGPLDMSEIKRKARTKTVSDADE